MESNSISKWMWFVVVIAAAAGIYFIIRNGNVPETASTPQVSTSTSKVSSQPPAQKTQTTKPASNTTSPIQKAVGNVPTKNLVRLTNEGFKPFILEINRGESVEFLNDSDKAMIIRTNDEKPENRYLGFSQESGPLGKGGKFYFAFTIPGTWPYYNANSGLKEKKDQGVIVVK